MIANQLCYTPRNNNLNKENKLKHRLDIINLEGPRDQEFLNKDNKIEQDLCWLIKKFFSIRVKQKVITNFKQYLIQDTVQIPI